MSISNKNEVFTCDLCEDKNFNQFAALNLINFKIFMDENNSKRNKKDEKGCFICISFGIHHISNKYHYNAFYRINYRDRFNDQMDVCQLFKCNSLFSKCDCNKKHNKLIKKIIKYIKKFNVPRDITNLMLSYVPSLYEDHRMEHHLNVILNCIEK